MTIRMFAVVIDAGLVTMASISKAPRQPRNNLVGAVFQGALSFGDRLASGHAVWIAL